MRQSMIEKRYKEIVEDFVAMKCERDGPALPNQVQPQSIHESIFKEIDVIVSFYKRFEYEVRTSLDTPIKLMHIFRIAKVFLINQQKGHPTPQASTPAAAESESPDLEAGGNTFSSSNFAYQELGNLFNEDITMDEMDKLLQFELLLFKRVELNEKPNSQQQFGKAHPYLSNSYNLFADVFDCSYSSSRNGKAPLDMEHMIEHANFQDVLQAVSILDK